jgi:tetratricopeptide (TPR) repeat protein
MASYKHGRDTLGASCGLPFVLFLCICIAPGSGHASPDGRTVSEPQSASPDVASLRMFRSVPEPPAAADGAEAASEDEKLFVLAGALERGGDHPQALQAYKDLVRTYPTSPRVPEAYGAIGELHFVLGETTDALIAFKKASAYRGFDIHPFALYKLSWCYFLIGENAAAIDTVGMALDTDNIDDWTTAAGTLESAAREAQARFISERQ